MILVKLMRFGICGTSHTITDRQVDVYDLDAKNLFSNPFKELRQTHFPTLFHRTWTGKIESKSHRDVFKSRNDLC